MGTVANFDPTTENVVRSFTKLTDRMPNPQEHPRVLIFTEGADFAGEQYFDVNSEFLNEAYFEDPDNQPEVCRHATHWAPRPCDIVVP